MMQENDNESILVKIEFVKSLVIKYKSKAIAYFTVALVLGLCSFFYSEKEYTSDAIGLSYKVPSDYVVDIILDVEDAIKEHDDTTVAKLLNISIVSANKIVAISASSLDENKNVKDDGDLSQPNYFKVKITSTDKKIFDTLNSSLIQLINSNDFISQKIAADKDYLSKNINYIVNEIDTLTKVKNEIEKRIINGESSKNVMLLTDFSKIQSNIVDLKSRLEIFKNKFNRITGISIVKKFIKPRKKSAPKFIPIIVVFELIALLLFILNVVISFNLEKRKVEE